MKRHLIRIPLAALFAAILGAFCEATKAQAAIMMMIALTWLEVDELGRMVRQPVELGRALADLVHNVEHDLAGYWTESTANMVQQAHAALAKLSRK